MSASAVATQATTLLDGMAGERNGAGAAIDIVSVEAANGADVPRLTGTDLPVNNGMDDSEAVFWVIKANGPFYGDHVPPGQPPALGKSGYFVIGDATGDLVGWGIIERE
jgi:hypothetical protein